MWRNGSAEGQVSILFYIHPSKCAGIYGGKTNIKSLFLREAAGKIAWAALPPAAGFGTLVLDDSVLFWWNENYLSSPPPAHVLLGPGGAVRGGGARPRAAGAHGHRGEEKPAAEGARPQGQALPEERPQGCAKGRRGGAGAAGEAEGRREDSGAPPQHHHAGGAAAGALHEHGDTPEDPTVSRWLAAARKGRDCWAIAMWGSSTGKLSRRRKLPFLDGTATVWAGLHDRTDVQLSEDRKGHHRFYILDDHEETSQNLEIFICIYSLVFFSNLSQMCLHITIHLMLNFQ